ncbi:MAG TPA: hypothetical protein ENI60_06460 [Candidatus Fraserbacteria bacterium]|nr:hypothetical protein [Candidatus Fraserbacteria bacterium]
MRHLLAAVSNRRDLAIIYTTYRYGLRASEVGFEESGGDSQKRRCGSSITLESKVRAGRLMLICSGLSSGRAGPMVR